MFWFIRNTFSESYFLQPAQSLIVPLLKGYAITPPVTTGPTGWRPSLRSLSTVD